MPPPMGFWSNIFTWWNGATGGTALWTRRFGNEVGTDDAGNVYYADKKNGRAALGDLQRQQRRQPGPARLAAWLRGTIDEVPDKALPPVRKFQQKPTGEPHRHDGAVQARRRAGIGPAAAGFDRRLRALDPRITVRAAADCAVRARARGLRPRRRAAERAPPTERPRPPAAAAAPASRRWPSASRCSASSTSATASSRTSRCSPASRRAGRT